MGRILKSLIWCTAVVGAGAASAQPVQTLRVGRSIEWMPQQQPDGAIYQSGNITLDLRPARDSDADNFHTVLTVSTPGMAPVTVQGQNTGPGFGQQVGVGRWSRDGELYVLFQTFSGGAHCCTTRQVVYPEGGQLRVIDLGASDGSAIGNMPTDVDGDGVVDFFDVDNAFLYTFSSYAGSMAPPTVTNVVGGRAVDVSAKPSFRPYFERFARQARTACADRRNVDRNGACAGYVAASARIGRFDTAWADMLRAYDRNTAGPSGCRVPQGTEGCPEGQETAPLPYPEGLRAFLGENGYLPAAR